MKPQLHRPAGRTAKHLIDGAINVVMPPRCPVTETELSQSGVLHPTAWAKIQFLDDPKCPQCGVPFSVDYGDGVICPACIAEPPVFDRARAALLYDESSHRLIVRFKHSDRTDLAPMFGRWMVRAGEEFLADKPLLVPIPLHPLRLISRRYNQSMLLADRIASLTGCPTAMRLLKRTRATPPQQSLSAEARTRNVAGAFALRWPKTKIRGANVVLIDDVLTTGATLSAAAAVLKRAGAARVDVLVLARVVKGGVSSL